MDGYEVSVQRDHKPSHMEQVLSSRRRSKTIKKFKINLIIFFNFNLRQIYLKIGKSNIIFIAIALKFILRIV